MPAGRQQTHVGLSSSICLLSRITFLCGLLINVRKEVPHALSTCAVSFLLENRKSNSYSLMLRTILAFVYLKNMNESS